MGNDCGVPKSYSGFIKSLDLIFWYIKVCSVLIVSYLGMQILLGLGLVGVFVFGCNLLKLIKTFLPELLHC